MNKKLLIAFLFLSLSIIGKISASQGKILVEGQYLVENPSLLDISREEDRLAFYREKKCKNINNSNVSDKKKIDIYSPLNIGLKYGSLIGTLMLIAYGIYVKKNKK